jgi:4-amino-4-deoxy-L-arabinose transferase-like glycosyltransferase
MLHQTPPTTRPDRFLWAILLLTAVIRLAFILVIDPNPSVGGADIGWYLEKGQLLATNSLNDPVQTGPIFLLLAGLSRIYFADSAVLVLRLLNVLWHLLLAVAVYHLATRYFGLPQKPRAVARLATLILAISPAFVIEAGAPLTESLFMAILFGVLAAYAPLAQPDTPMLVRQRRVLLVGALLGLAALTRVVIMAFPVLLALHLLVGHGWRRGGQLAALLLLAFTCTLGTWTIYNAARWGRFIIGGEGLTAFAWMGTTNISDARAIDAAIGVDAAAAGQRDGAFVQGFLASLLGDPIGWAGNRAKSLAEAYLQPHNTVYYPGESLKTLTLNWLQTDRTLDGLIQVAEGDSFWPKLVLYLFHFAALGLGLVAALAGLRKDFWQRWPLYALVGYFSAVHFVIYAIPRYLFPVAPVFYLFAALLVLKIASRRAQKTI